MTMDELAVMDGSMCICQVRGVRPFFSKKFDITKHDNYELLSDFNEKNAFSIEKLVSQEITFKKNDVTEVFDCGVWEETDIDGESTS